jgi:hypothetical protein
VTAKIIQFGKPRSGAKRRRRRSRAEPTQAPDVPAEYAPDWLAEAGKRELPPAILDSAPPPFEHGRSERIAALKERIAEFQRVADALDAVMMPLEKEYIRVNRELSAAYDGIAALEGRVAH